MIFMPFQCKKKKIFCLPTDPKNIETFPETKTFEPAYEIMVLIT